MWQIGIIGEISDIELLETLLKGSQYEVTKEGDEFLLTLPDVPLDADSEQVKAAADRLVDIINGAARLYYKRFGEIKYVKVSRVNTEGRRVGFGYLSLAPRDFTLTAIRPGDKTLIEWVDLAFVSDELSRALYLYGSLEPSWKNLYMVLETVEDDFGGEEALIKASIIPKRELKLFKRTANSYRAIGRESRHGTRAFTPLRNHMTLKSAQELIRNLLLDWIGFKKKQSS
jgi:hypothetical protein